MVRLFQVMIQIYCMCTVWGEPLSQTAQSFMPELLYGAKVNLPKVVIYFLFLPLLYFNLKMDYLIWLSFFLKQ